MIVVDVEASGVDPHKHSLLSIGAVDFLHPQNQFYAECKIWEGAHVMDEALAVNGYTRVQTTDSRKKTEKEIVEDFLRWAGQCKERTIAGENPSFDRDFIRAACERNHINWPFAYRTIDMHSVCYFHMIKQGIRPPTVNGHTALNSDAIAQYCGIPAESKPHVAIGGAKIEAEIFSRLFYNESLLDEYRKYPIPWIEK
jgi:DNA polymerase-3 subunit epsilon